MFTPASNQRSRTYTSVLPNFSSTPLQLSCSSVAAVERIRTLKPSKNHAYTPQPSLLIVLSCLNSLYFLYLLTPFSSSALLLLRKNFNSPETSGPFNLLHFLRYHSLVNLDRSIIISNVTYQTLFTNESNTCYNITE